VHTASAPGFSALALSAGLAMPAIAGGLDPAAELIALCDLFVQNEAKQAGLFVTIRDDDERDAPLKPLSAEWDDAELHAARARHTARMDEYDGGTKFAGRLWAASGR
jgi:hypothetical protein